MKKIGLGFAMLGLALLGSSVSGEAAVMHRLYNPNSGEHFYTAHDTEKQQLVTVGWKDEGQGWTAPETGDPVYRLYNPNAGDHHYTLNTAEKNQLLQIGWKDEGIGWYSDSQKGVPLFRSYNPNAKAGSHNYTVSRGEQESLLKVGWKDEAVGWYGVDPNPPALTEQEKNQVKAFDELSPQLQTLLMLSVADQRANTPELTGYFMGYHLDQGYFYGQIHSGVGTGHPVYEFTMNENYVIPTRGASYIGFNQIYTVRIPQQPQAKWELYQKYLAQKASFDTAVTKASDVASYTKSWYDKFCYDAIAFNE